MNGLFGCWVGGCFSLVQVLMDNRLADGLGWVLGKCFYDMKGCNIETLKKNGRKNHEFCMSQLVQLDETTQQHIVQHHYHAKEAYNVYVDKSIFTSDIHTI